MPRLAAKLLRFTAKNYFEMASKVRLSWANGKRPRRVSQRVENASTTRYTTPKGVAGKQHGTVPLTCDTLRGRIPFAWYTRATCCDHLRGRNAVRMASHGKGPTLWNTTLKDVLACGKIDRKAMDDRCLTQGWNTIKTGLKKWMDQQSTTAPPSALHPAPTDSAGASTGWAA